MGSIEASLRAEKTMRRTKKLELPFDTIIEVVAIRGDKVTKKEMTYGGFLNMDRAKGWIYKSYQLGFCTMKEKP